MQQQSFKRSTAALDNDRVSNKPSWESFYFRENSGNGAWTRSEREIRKSDMRNASWLWNRRESTNSDHPCKNSSKKKPGRKKQKEYVHNIRQKR